MKIALNRNDSFPLKISKINKIEINEEYLEKFRQIIKEDQE